MGIRAGIIVGLLAVLVLAGCSVVPTAIPSIAPTVSISCGPVVDEALCHKAVEVAATAKINPPPITAAWIRRPRADDGCTLALQPCGSEAVIVVIQSGDTLQDIPLVPSADGWIRLDLIR